MAEEEKREAPLTNWYSNDRLYRMLMASAANGHLCHAYLFFGPRGAGKKSLAKELARAILCRGENPPCNECVSCRKVLSGNHPDLWIYTEKGGANSIHIETVRMLRQDAYVRPNDGERKVYLLPGAEDMSAGAANAFLKVLEEPPAHTVFLLTADSRDRLPETVCSRCVQMELFPWAEEDVLTVLKGRFPERPEEELRQAAEFSGGLIGRALDSLTNEDFQDIGRLAGRMAEGLLQGGEYEVLAGLSGANQSKERMRLLLDRFSGVLRAALLCKLSGRGEGGRVAEGLAARLTAGQISAMAELLEEARAGIDGNANLGLLANCLSANLMQAAGK